MKKLLIACFSLFGLALFATAQAATSQPTGKIMAKSIVISNLFIRETAPNQKTAAAYLTIENKNNFDVMLTKVTVPSNVAKSTQLHKMTGEDEHLHMEKQSSITIPKHGEFKLEMGGYHVMLIGVKKQLKEDDNITVLMTFVFKDAKGNEVSVTEKAPIQNVFTIQPYPNVN